jgi:DNA-binding Lrp family transcriptional regulator
MRPRKKTVETYWILDRKQILCFASARRHDIIDKLVAAGPLSIRELAPLVGASAPSLYHHVRKLVRAGLVVEAGHRVVNRKRETIYATVAPRMRMARALENPKNMPALRQVAAGLSRQMARDFNAGGRSRSVVAMGDRRNFGFFRLIGAPDNKGLAEINRHFDAIAELMWNSGNKGNFISIGWMMAPVLVGAHRTKSGDKS